MDGYWFTSSLFTIEPGEDDETNPGRFGRQLAVWLKARLEQRGYTIEPIVPEDWGRLLVCSRKPFLLSVGCSNMEADADETASADEIIWHCFASIGELPFFSGRSKKDAARASLVKLDGDLLDILSSDNAVELVVDPLDAA